MHLHDHLAGPGVLGDVGQRLPDDGFDFPDERAWIECVDRPEEADGRHESSSDGVDLLDDGSTAERRPGSAASVGAQLEDRGPDLADRVVDVVHRPG